MEDFEHHHLPSENLGRWHVSGIGVALWMFACAVSALCAIAAAHTNNEPQEVFWTLATISVVLGFGVTGCLIFFIIGGRPAARFGLWFGVIVGGLAVLSIPSLM